MTPPAHAVENDTCGLTRRGARFDCYKSYVAVLLELQELLDLLELRAAERPRR